MAFQLTQVNKEIVNPIKPLKEPDTRPVRGANLFAECNVSVFICASRGSGKTSVVGKIMRDCVGKDTKIIVFCANLDKDKSWIALQHHFEEKGYDFDGYTSITDPETGTNLLDVLNEQILERAKEEKELARLEEEQAKYGADPDPRKTLREQMFGAEPDEDGKPKKKSKYREPEYIIVFDDLSDEIRNSSQVARILKNGRHFCKVIISSQYLKDLKPEARTNIDYFILFKGLDEPTLETVFRNAKLSIDFETFKALYKDATGQKYHFLYIDTRENKFRKNFTPEYAIPE